MKNRPAFTVLELLIVLGIIAVLASLGFIGFDKARQKAQRAQCSNNLRALYVAAEQYLQDNNQWPQIGMDPESDTGAQAFAQQWIAALAPYNIPQRTWICPSIENLLGNPDYSSPGNERVDYFGMTFDDKPTTPHQWPRQPWFFETADVHGHGQLIIFTDGSISDLKSVTGGG